MVINHNVKLIQMDILVCFFCGKGGGGDGAFRKFGTLDRR